MATPLPPVRLLLDLSTILSTQTRHWIGFSGIGDCVVPQPVLDELNFLVDRAPEPGQEAVARAFARFYPNSHWGVTSCLATGPQFVTPAGVALSKQARINLAVAQCACAVAQDNPGSLIVVVANNSALARQLQNVRQSNLCCITPNMLVQWTRTQQPPTPVQQAAVGAWVPGASLARVPVAATRPKWETRPQSATPRPTFSPDSAKHSPNQKSTTQPQPARPSGALLSVLLSLTLLVVLVLVGFHLVAPQQFNQWWQKLGLPALPKS
ncbi:hypothetical protein [Leptolyngbya sp. FACHB-261]|uniref:hypothetical protein n=1 Tax=Leptolyngbya sp. FACHB-261 TaxID=2692806 RepID=UPI001685369B|nr:hypothetical protein [Leptolyngbya sp. FACHB-261]MBD2100756.1 hypothetical protein [Leptolyngbya sp. FACHB-261]